MKKRQRWIQLLLVCIVFCHFSTPAVYVWANEQEQSVRHVYVLRASEQKELDQKQAAAILEEAAIAMDNYTIQKPLSLFSITEEGKMEDYYFPILCQGKLAALIRYSSKTDSYRLEAEKVVSNLADYQGQTTNTAPLVLLEVDQQIIGKDEKNIYNFSNKNTLETEKEALFLQADLSDVMLSNTMNLYAETTDEQTNVDSSQATEETTSLQETTEASETTTTEVSRNTEESVPQAIGQTEEVELTIPETSKAQQLPKQARAVQSAGLFPQSERLDFNQSVTGEISKKGEKRYYQFEVPVYSKGTVYEEYSIYLQGNFARTGVLYDKDGNYITSSFSSYSSDDVKIQRKLEPGIYYLEIRASHSKNTGEYAVRVERKIGRDDNYNFESAEKLPLNTDQLAQIDFGHQEYGGDKDYYKIEIPTYSKGTVYEEYSIYLQGNFARTGVLYDKDGNYITSSSSSYSSDDVKIQRKLEPGIYYLEIRASHSKNTGEYAVRVERKIGRDDNYNFESAEKLPLNTDQLAQIDFGHQEYGGDKDYYKIEIPTYSKGTVYEEYSIYLQGNFARTGVLYDKDGNYITSSSSSYSGDDVKIQRKLEPGIYYLEIRASHSKDTGSYLLSVKPITLSEENLVRIHSTGSYSGTISATAKETTKLYEFYVWDKPQGTVFREHQFNFTANLFGTMTLLDANQKPLATIDYRGQALSSKIIQALEKGKYYLEIRTQGSYSFSINEKNISNDSNRSFEEAKLLWGKQTIKDTIDFGEASKYAGDEDYFKLFIPSYEYGKYTIQLSNANVVGQLYNDQKELIHGDFKQSLTQKLKPGIYYVKVRGEHANIRGSYQISFAGKEAFEEAESLALNETIQSDLSAAQGAKYYKFQVANLSQLDFYLANSHVTTIEVYDQNYKKLIGKTWESTNHKVSGVFLPGSYYIKIASKSATKYKLMIKEEQRNENRIELVNVGMSKQIYLNGSPSPELTQILNQRFAARALLLPSDFSIIDFVQGMVTEWTINTGGVPLLDAIFGTDRTSYLQDWRLRSKSYALGMYAGDGISLVQGTVSLVGAGMFFIGGNLFGVGGTPFTGGASLTLCPVTTAVTVAVAAEASTMVVSAVKNMGEGHRWDPELDPEYKQGDCTPKGREYTRHGAKRTNERGFNSKKIDDIIDNNSKNRVKEIDSDTGEITWRYQDKRGNTVITNEWVDKIVTVYSYPKNINGGKYIPK
jgi:hypothetical protein